MKERKNIEHLFQERFENFEVIPPENAWENIEMRLNEKKNKKRIIPFWWKLSGIAALLALGFFVFNDFNSIAIPNNSVVNQDSISTDKNSSLPVIEDINQNKNNDNKEKYNPITTADAEAKKSDSNLDIEAKTNTSINNSVVNNSIGKKDFRNKNSKVAAAGSETNFENDFVQTNSQSSKNKENSTNTLDKDILKSSSENIALDTKINQNSNSQFQKNNKNSNSVFDEKSFNSSVIIGNSNTKNNTITNSNTISKDLKNESFGSTVISKTINNNATFNGNSPKSNTIENSITENNITLKDSTIVAVVEPNALEELLKEKENPTKIVEQKLNRWQLSTNVAPIYFSSTGNGSPLDSQFENNSKTYNTSISYGMGVNYAVNKKIKIRTGVNRLTADYNTNDVVFFQDNNASRIQNVRTNLQGSVLQVESKLRNTSAPVLSLNNVELQKFDSSLNQRFGFLEVPVEMSYRIIDKKIGVDFIGGVSTLFLNENQVSINSNGLNMQIGEADNLNKIHFSGNLGIGIKYEFIKRFEARIEPIFKYQLNTFTNNDGNFRPYVLGIYSGVSFTF